MLFVQWYLVYHRYDWFVCLGDRIRCQFIWQYGLFPSLCRWFYHRPSIFVTRVEHNDHPSDCLIIYNVRMLNSSLYLRYSIKSSFFKVGLQPFRELLDLLHWNFMSNTICFESDCLVFQNRFIAYHGLLNGTISSFSPWLISNGIFPTFFKSNDWNKWPLHPIAPPNYFLVDKA